MDNLLWSLELSLHPVLSGDGDRFSNPWLGPWCGNVSMKKLEYIVFTWRHHTSWIQTRRHIVWLNSFTMQRLLRRHLLLPYLASNYGNILPFNLSFTILGLSGKYWIETRKLFWVSCLFLRGFGLEVSEGTLWVLSSWKVIPKLLPQPRKTNNENKTMYSKARRWNEYKAKDWINLFRIIFYQWCRNSDFVEWKWQIV